nr:MAG TPA: hypothetical protein [Caudoviricetes sp.]
MNSFKSIIDNSDLFFNLFNVITTNSLHNRMY